MLQCRRILICLLLLEGCKPTAPEPPARLDSRAIAAVTPTGSADAERSTIWGDPIPQGAARIELLGSSAKLGGKPLGDLRAIGKALLITDFDTFLAEAAPVLEMLDRSAIETWLVHPAAPVAFKLTLKDERAFQSWLDQPIPGRIRVVQRADGLELQTGLGKLAGPDPNGPTIPLREGQLDLRSFRQSLLSLQRRFQNANDACLVPSFGTEIAKIATALSGFYRAPGERIFSEICLVYPASPSAASGDR
jgi:hypothetical protein